MLLPETVTANGVTRRLTSHARDKASDEVTAEGIQYVLEHWRARGICVDSRNRTTITYWGFPPGGNYMLRVVVSLDDRRIITAHRDYKAARRLDDAGRPWFAGRCRDLEVRDAG